MIMKALERRLRYAIATFELLQADRTDWYFLGNLIQYTFAFEISGDHLAQTRFMSHPQVQV